jgi:hypothetical protein
MNWIKIADQAVIGIVSIALRHIMDEDYRAAKGTLRALIMTLEGREEE